MWLKEEHLKLYTWLLFPLGRAVPDYTYAALDASSLWALTLSMLLTDLQRHRGQHYRHRGTLAKCSLNSETRALEPSELISGWTWA